MAFIDAHATEVAAAVHFGASAPAFLSGLTPAELGIVKQRKLQARAIQKSPRPRPKR